MEDETEIQTIHCVKIDRYKLKQIYDTIKQNDKFNLIRLSKWRATYVTHIKYNARVVIFESGKISFGKASKEMADEILDDLL